jgi:outer membrane protein assembly factor BamB
MKLDPRKPDNPLVWSLPDQGQAKAGVWGTPALYKDVVIFDTHPGDALAVDRQTGAVRWRMHFPGGETWQSPVVVDDVLVIGDCKGDLHAYDIGDTHAEPKPLWSKTIGGCVESTPAVWKGSIYFGTRAGAFHALAAGG